MLSSQDSLQCILSEIENSPLDSFSAVKYLLNSGVAFSSLLLDTFEGHLFFVFQQLRAGGRAGVMPATVVSVSPLPANSQPAPVVRNASQSGLQDNCPNSRRGSLSTEPEPVEAQLQILWPGGAERVKMVNFNLV